MQKKSFDIIIKNVKHSELSDTSLNYIIDFCFKINDIFFKHTDYLNSADRETIKKLTKKSQVPTAEQRLKLITEIEVRLRITDTHAQQMFYQVLDAVDQYIDGLQDKERRFPTQSRLISEALKYGFWLTEHTPDRIHLMKPEWKRDRELHIRATSIHFLVQEITDFAAGGDVFESYSYRQMMQQNIDQLGITIAVNPFGNGWLLEDWYQPGHEFPCQHVQTLKELNHRINMAIARKDRL